MRTCLLFVASGLAVAQSAATTYIVDINGRPVTGSVAVAVDGVVTDIRQSINGRELPLEQVEQKVLSKDGNTTVTERLVHHYGTDGRLVSTDRIVTEETKNGADASTVRATTFRTDLNGNLAEAERKTVETHKQGAATVTETAVETRPMGGGFHVTEKRTAISEATNDGKRENETVYLPDINGALFEAQRLATTETKTGNQSISNTATYEPGVNGQMSLTRQSVVTTTANPDGSSSQETDIYGRPSDARTRAEGTAPSLTVKTVTERQKRPDGAVVETQHVQVPSINDPGRLDAPRIVYETVCRGECDKKP